MILIDLEKCIISPLELHLTFVYINFFKGEIVFLLQLGHFIGRQPFHMKLAI